MPIEDQIREHVSLAPMTTLGVGGAARRYTEIASVEELQALLALAGQNGWPVQMLGAGSNILCSDEGLDALVVRWRATEIKVRRRGPSVRLRVAAGCDWDELVARSVNEGWAGSECLSGIPGTVGAAPIQNIGAYGQEVAEVVSCVHLLRLPGGEAISLNADACGFTYRDSLFKREAGWIVTAVELHLVAGGPASVRYAEIERSLAQRELAPTLANVRETVLSIRATKGMLLDHADPESRSAGSFFMNPIVTTREAKELAAKFDAAMPSWPVDEHATQRKLSAAWMIEHCGFEKGQRLGGARISRKHVLALVNGGEAKARDLLDLAREIQRAVLERTSVRLDVEPRLLGFSPEELGELGTTARQSSS
jgi:UDP-N-acetylmuramate dehydrogenase